MIDKGHESMVYRFKGLIRAIEFFSQRFDVEQIVHYALEFVDELMMVDKVAVIIEEDRFYVPVKQRNYHVEEFSMEATQDLKDIVVLHAGLFEYDDLKRLFPATLSEAFKCSVGIPLVMDKKLYGFILLDRFNSENTFDSDDYMFASALMNLFYTALSNYEAYEQLISIKKRLDEKIFNLFAINQSSKVLMGTLEIKDICDLSISVFSELTQSAITSLFLYDAVSEAYKMVSIQNVYELNQGVGVFAYQTDKVAALTNKSYFDMEIEAERSLFAESFHNGDLLIDDLEPVYVIPVYKNTHLLGFITLGKRVNDSYYSDGIIELVESLSSSLYVSISNAMQVQIIQEQKVDIDSKLQKLMTLNRLIKNINTSTDLKDLLEITNATLDLSLGVKCGLIAQYDGLEQCFVVRESIECDDFTRVLSLSKVLEDLKEGKVVVANSIVEAEDILGNDFVRNIEGKYSGAVFVPIYLDKYEVELLGVLCVFDVEGQIIGDQANNLMFESIANTIAPIWYQLAQMEHMKSKFIANGFVTFKEQLIEEMNDCDDFQLDLYVLEVVYEASNYFDQCEEFETLSLSNKKSHVIDNSHMLIITGVVSDYENLKKQLRGKCSVQSYCYKKDFVDYDSFVDGLT